MELPDRLVAAGELTLACPASGPWRLRWREPDWLGPLSFNVHRAGRRYCGLADTSDPSVLSLGAATRMPFCGSDDLGSYAGMCLNWEGPVRELELSARAYAQRPVIVFRIEARGEVPQIATGEYRDVSVAWPTFAPRLRSNGGLPAGARTYAHQVAEFALPVFGDHRATGFLFAPHRPAAVLPLMFIAPDGRTLLIAPLDHFHEQTIGVPRNQGDDVRCGWHGDLAEIPPRFATEMALWAAAGPRQALEEWCAFLRQRHATRPRSRYADEGVGKLSYWTDNGAVYYYRTEPGLDYTATLVKVVEQLRAAGVPVASLQIDSWFYPHENLRPISPEGTPIVPPSGAMRWEPRSDVFPEGIHDLRQRTGGLPLTLHSRHFSSRSPYFDRHACWRDGPYAHPCEASFYEMLMEQAAAWGAITYEQDWMAESFLGVRPLRAAAGRCRQWLEMMDTAARDRGLTLQFCMATPADFLQAATLTQVTSIRTSGDYRYLFDNGLNWVWFLHCNALARSLGLNPFKDVFLSHSDTSLAPGEPYAEIEALLAALSTGPVAIGDRIGATVRELVLRCCRADGVLVKPDVPIAAVDACFATNTFLHPAPLIGETYSGHPAGRWSYVATLHACQAKGPLAARVGLEALGAWQPTGPVLIYDWRRGSFARAEPGGGWSCQLDFQDWDYRVVCPLLPGEATVFGDVSKYATVADRHVARIQCRDGCLEMSVLDRPGTLVEVQGYAAEPPRRVDAWVPEAERSIARDSGDERWSWDSTGRWRVRIRVDSNGHTRLRVTLRDA